MDRTQAKHTTNLTKFFSFQNISLRQNLNKNYVNLIPPRVRRRPTNKFCVQSQVKQNKRTNLKRGSWKIRKSLQTAESNNKNNLATES